MEPTMSNTQATMAYRGRIDGDQTDAQGDLTLEGAAGITAAALHAAAATPLLRSVTLRRTDGAALRLSETVTCTLAPADHAGQLLARIAGPQGVAWEADVRLTGPMPAAPAVPEAVSSLPPMQSMRPMRAGDCDQAGHVNVRVFMELADEATWILLADALGGRAGLRIDQIRISFKRELFRGDVVTVHSGVRRADAQGVDVVHGIVHQPSGAVACVVETRLATEPDADGSTTAAHQAIERLKPLAGEWPSLPPARAPAAPRAGANPGSGTVVTAVAVVDAWDCDASAHLSLRALVNLCSTGARQYLATIGLTGQRFLRERITVAAVDYLIDVARRPALGSNLTLRTAFLSGSAKSIRFAHHLVDSDTGTLYAVVEIVGVMLDLAAHRSMEIPADVKQRLGLG
jgi:acyl-CoA thioesterase FadM